MGLDKRCQSRRMCPPTLRKRGHEWFLDFPFEEETLFKDKSISERTVLAVDLGINSAATVCAMRSDGTILGRHFLKLPKEYDSLTHSTNRIKKAQQYGNRKTPRLWAKAKGTNRDIAAKTAASSCLSIWIKRGKREAQKNKDCICGVAITCNP